MRASRFRSLCHPNDKRAWRTHYAGKCVGKICMTERSFELFQADDLRRLSEIALEDLGALFEKRPETGRLYQDRLLMLCLCQGGAEHFVRREYGVKDLDIWAFFAEHPSRPFPYRRRGVRDFGPSKFGRHPNDGSLQGRRVDIIGRSIPCASEETAKECILR